MSGFLHQFVDRFLYGWLCVRGMVMVNHSKHQKFDLSVNHQLHAHTHSHLIQTAFSQFYSKIKRLLLYNAHTHTHHTKQYGRYKEICFCLSSTNQQMFSILSVLFRSAPCSVLLSLSLLFVFVYINRLRKANKCYRNNVDFINCNSNIEVNWLFDCESMAHSLSQSVSESKPVHTTLTVCI